jgi:hypothetical protein
MNVRPANEATKVTIERTHRPTNGIGCANPFGKDEAQVASRL